MAKVLIGYSACPLTRAAFEAAGHEVWTCDLLPARDGSHKHLQMDVWEALRGWRWDFAVLHPMCTYLTVSAAWAFKDPDFDKYPGVGYHQRLKPGTLTGEERRVARDEALRNFRNLLHLPFPVAIENPGHSFVSSAIRPADQIVHPYQFGDDASKATGFWLSPLVPHLQPTTFCKPRLVCGNCKATHSYDEYAAPCAHMWNCEHCGAAPGFFKARWANQTDSGQNNLSPGDNRWLERSKTYPGIAEAMGAQWGAWLNK